MSLTDQLKKARRIFLDTAPVIYYVEKNPTFASKLQPLFDRFDDGNLMAVVSPITLAECLVLPYKLGKPEVTQVFSDLKVNSQSVLFYPIDEPLADNAARLRASYNLTLTDAFQVAIAIQSGCDAFLTNDIELKRIKDIPIIVVSE
jgi:predicted nucleic acid-binding protein